MGSKRETAEKLYPALAGGDKALLVELLSEDLVGVTTEGLPFGLGGRYEGRTNMLRDFYGTIARNYHASADPASFVELADGRLLVTGRYKGHAVASGQELDAAFVHILSFDDHGQISQIEQMTDSGRWRDAVESELSV